ncbi:protein brown [Diachasma alloeum]|uniref:protein brown n=1 Tax=Diachasma alloeum TaxID=454923 RepID=UPI0007381004|nr:protein brown [Diachasma alloeum]
MDGCASLLKSDVHGVNPFDNRINGKLLLSWDNLTVKIRTKRSFWDFFSVKVGQVPTKLVLRDNSGFAETGQLVAIMGPSGAGKTTLLATLARLTDPAAGSIRLNGVELSKGDMSTIASFVPQFDPLPAMLTTGEYISFFCALKLDKCTSARERSFLAMRIIEELGLLDSRDVLISKISGGERKRVSIAAEMVTKPRILFLDEPTTGLDSCSALRVIQSIKIATSDSIVLCSIHQPGITLYNLFSHVVFLTEGRTAFFGSLENAKIFFQREGYNCPHGFDEAEYYIKVLSSRHSEDLMADDLDRNNAEGICNAYSRSSFSDFSEKIGEGPVGFEIENIEKSSARWFTQVNWLAWRYYLENIRAMMNGLIAFFYYAISIVLIGIFYIGIDTERQSGVKDTMGMLYMTGTELVYSSAYTVLYEVQSEIPIYLRERRFYGPTAYYLAMVFSWVPKVMAKSLFLTTSIILILRYDEGTFFIFLEYFVATTACGICASAYGIMIACHIERVSVAIDIMAPINLLAMLMAGVFYNLRTLSWVAGWLKYLSIFHYSHEMMAIIHWSRVARIECDTKHLPCFESGADVLAEYGYSQRDWWGNAGGLLALTGGAFFVGFLGALRRRVVKSLY